MSISNYGELKTAIADFLNRDDLTAVIPTFVDLAEADIVRDRRARSWRAENRATTSATGRYSALPQDYVEMIRISVSTTQGWERLSLISQADMMQKREYGDVGGKPEFYAITAGELELFPTPDEAYTVEIVYHNRFPALVDDIDTNWVLQYHPDVYLYGSLSHAAPYLAEDGRLTVFAAMYQTALDKIAADTDASKYSGTGLRMGVPK